MSGDHMRYNIDKLMTERNSINDATPEEWDRAVYATEKQVGGGHYKEYVIQPVDFITANNVPFLEGCVIKRMMRHKRKNGVEDLDKAIHEIQLIRELVYGQQ